MTDPAGAPEAHLAPEAPEAPGAPGAPGATGTPDTPEVRSYSPNWAAPILFVALLFGATTQRGNVWSYVWHALYFALVVLGAYTAFSPKELADEQRRRPGTARADHLLMTAVPYVFVPLLGWILAVPFGYKWGALVPAAPWLLLLLLVPFALLGGKARS